MRTRHQQWHRFLRAGEAASALEYTILVAVFIAGVGGVLIAFSEQVNEPFVPIGAGVAAIQTPEIDIGE